jgi:outer membrane protein assembly factor BamB
MKTLLRTAAICAAAIGILSAGLNSLGSEQEPRTWTSADGQHRTQAILLGFQDGKVQLRRADGKQVAVASAALCAADREYVRAELQRRKQAAAKSSDAKSSSSQTAPAAAGGEWPRWRGPQLDAHCAETGLLQPWPDGGPRLLWQIEGLGTGYASVSVAGGKIFTMGRKDGVEHLIALQADDGSPLWSTPVGPGRNQKGSNCSPTVDGELVYAISIEGDLICARADSGAPVWQKNFARDFGGKMMSGWGFSESPLVDGDTLLCTPGGPQAVVAALDKRTGRTLWTTAMPYGGSQGQDGAGYSSIVISHGAGVKQYVQLVGRGLIGVAADSGRLLWRYDRIANGVANIPTPIVSGDFIFCSTGYQTGAALLKLTRSGDGVQAVEQYFLESDKLQNHHGGMVLLDGHIYCGHRHNQGFPICVEMSTGRICWGGDQRGAGSGSAAVLFADGHLYFRYQNGVMALIEATPERYNLKSSFKLASVRAESWPHPVIAGGRLLVRDQEVLMCYDVQAE